MGFALCQPDDEKEALEAMKEEDEGGKCKFDLCLSKLRLHPVCFGSRKCVNNERFFHSYVGEATAAAWAIVKNRHFLWARPFTLLTDCHALAWLMSYTGNNAAIRRLILEMSGYWFTIEHRNNKMMQDPDYWSRLDHDCDIDPLNREYVFNFKDLWKNHKAVQGEINKTNTPGRRKTDNDKSSQLKCNVISTQDQVEPNMKYHNVPVMYTNTQREKTYALNNSQIVQNHHEATQYNWAIYGFTSGHFINSIQTCLLPFHISFCADPNPTGRCQFAKQKVKNIHKSLRELHNAVQESETNIDAIYITCPDLTIKEHKARFLQECTSFFTTCNRNNMTKIIVIEYNTNFDLDGINSIKKVFETKYKWTSTSTLTQFTQFNDMIDDSLGITILFNKTLTTPSSKINLSIARPPKLPKGFNECVHQAFNRLEFSISSFPSNTTVSSDTYIGHVIDNVHNNKSAARAIATVRRYDNPDNIPTLQGSFVYDSHYPAPPLCSDNDNIFSNMFGIIFKAEDQKLHTRPIAFFEYCKMFQMNDKILQPFIQNPGNKSLLTNAMPAKTSAAILTTVSNILQKVTKEHHEYAITQIPEVAPAAISNVLLNSIVNHKLPDNSTWKNEILKDEECNLILQMIKNPSLVTQENLVKINCVYRQPMKQSMFREEQGIIFLDETIPSRNCSVTLRIVPKTLRNIIFISFHSNPMGGHFHLYQTLHRIRLRFHWPKMVQYIKYMIQRCPGCHMANATVNRKSVHLYSFPIDAPFRTIHIDIYTMGKTESFDGPKALFIVLDHMSSFAVIEPVHHLNSDCFAKALMKVLLTHGLCHTIIVDADSKFKATFTEAINLLHLNKHEISKGNHQAMLVERFNRYLNKVLKIFNNERGTNKTFVEGALLAAYAWNSSPVSGTDISKSLLVMGREYNFPIDFATDKVFSTNNSPQVIFDYTKNLVEILSQSRDIYKILIEEHRAMHREIRNSEIKFDREFKIGDIVFARRQVQSNKKKRPCRQEPVCINRPLENNCKP